MIIRQVNQKDYDNIYNLVKLAFQTAKVSDGTEQDFVYELRNRNTYIPELELVAEEEGEIIGHIMFTKQEIENSNKPCIGLLLAPLCVKLEKRSQGVGGKLIQAGVDKAIEMGYQVVFLVGDPNYYQRYGFTNISNYEIKNIAPIPDEFILAREITKNSLKDIVGKVNLH